jgi:hypothetical protein
LKKQYKQPKIPIKKQVNVDKEKGFYKLNGLTKQDIDYLLANKYKEFSAHSILSNKKEKYLIKPRFNESPQHFFLIHDIAEYLKKFTDKIQLFETKKPDIVFKIKNKRYAIEVETGTMLTRIKALEERKIYLDENYDEWFFVITNKNKVKDYKKLGDAVDKRYVKLRLNKLLKTAKKPQR